MLKRLANTAALVLVVLPVTAYAVAGIPIVTHSTPAWPQTPNVEMSLTMFGWIPQALAWHPPVVPITQDLPTFPPEEFPGLSGMPSTDGPPGPAADAEATLKRLAANLERTGSPVVPEGVPALFVAELEGGHFVYNLGRAPDRSWFESNRVFMLSRHQMGWTAVRICQLASEWIHAAGSTVVCAANHGSGALLVAAVYRAGHEVFRMEDILNGYLQVEARETGPPSLKVRYKREWMNHKHDPYLVERFTLRWDGDTYQLADQARMASGWPYHLARFLAFAEAAQWNRAAEHMVVPPEGVQAYLEKRAHGLTTRPDDMWTSLGNFPPDYPRAYVHRVNVAGPWYWFAFAQDGRVQAVGHVQTPPARQGRRE